MSNFGLFIGLSDTSVQAGNLLRLLNHYRNETAGTLEFEHVFCSCLIRITLEQGRCFVWTFIPQGTLFIRVEMNAGKFLIFVTRDLWIIKEYLISPEQFFIIFLYHNRFSIYIYT